MKLSDVKEFLKFRRKFSKLEWEELNKCVDYQERKRADQIILNDSDIEEILNRINHNAGPNTDYYLKTNNGQNKYSQKDLEFISNLFTFLNY